MIAALRMIPALVALTLSAGAMFAALSAAPLAPYSHQDSMQ